jgi:hypothetical protein
MAGRCTQSMHSSFHVFDSMPAQWQALPQIADQVSGPAVDVSRIRF